MLCLVNAEIRYLLCQWYAPNAHWCQIPVLPVWWIREKPKLVSRQDSFPSLPTSLLLGFRMPIQFVGRILLLTLGYSRIKFSRYQGLLNNLLCFSVLSLLFSKYSFVLALIMFSKMPDHAISTSFLTTIQRNFIHAS